tara:strand:- start:10 stop:330 length:321 start_codon:yes stop_codon:yes gene_type:complete
MKHHWIILALILLFQSDNFISIDEQRINFDKQRINWFNSLVEGTFIDGENSKIIKKQDNGNVTIELFEPEYVTIWEYDKTGRMISIGCGRTIREFIPIPKEGVIEQ